MTTTTGTTDVERVRRVYEDRHAALLDQVRPLTADDAEAERCLQAAVRDALGRPRAFAVAPDPEAWLRERAQRAARTVDGLPAAVGFDSLVEAARRRARRRTAWQLAAAVLGAAAAITLFLVLGSQLDPTGGLL
ncbi:hypothetical protein [Lapillicoccus jejuensis]|uniref:Uncharacterized protein n=1 Tax=Lapillicoccus jejuensis TaxID=402171 RepID=A0A542E028_9MICO|nr:hypothetical protein [Lapillicoccus jejuensis]TQJ08707.1 hypothetical protein FB458_1799 [Lapillicoccus jejuensis]